MSDTERDVESNGRRPTLGKACLHSARPRSQRCPPASRRLARCTQVACTVQPTSRGLASLSEKTCHGNLAVVDSHYVRRRGQQRPATDRTALPGSHYAHPLLSRQVRPPVSQCCACFRCGETSCQPVSLVSFPASSCSSRSSQSLEPVCVPASQGALGLTVRQRQGRRKQGTDKGIADSLRLMYHSLLGLGRSCHAEAKTATPARDACRRVQRRRSSSCCEYPLRSPCSCTMLTQQIGHVLSSRQDAMCFLRAAPRRFDDWESPQRPALLAADQQGRQGLEDARTRGRSNAWCTCRKSCRVQARKWEAGRSQQKRIAVKMSRMRGQGWLSTVLRSSPTRMRLRR